MRKEIAEHRQMIEDILFERRGSMSTPTNSAAGNAAPADTRNRAEPLPGSTMRAGLS
jgi:hypothetical protein